MTLYKLSRYSEWAPTILRVALGIAFIGHGAQKVFGAFGGPGLAGWVGFAATLGIPAVLAYIAAFTELLGGATILLGLFTRWAAALIGIVMIVAMAVARMNYFGGSELVIIYLASAIALMLTGPGAASLVKMLWKKEI